MSKVISSFTLSNETKKPLQLNKALHRREKIVRNLLEQGDIAKAMLEGTDYVATRLVTKLDVDGNPKEVEQRRRIKRWFFNNGGNEWYLEIRYANKAVELAKGKTSIVIPSKEKIVGTIELAVKVVEGGELDTAIQKLADEKRRSFEKAH
ncbi:hypothetical protein HOH51_04610 [bacterium]|jgi:hypothetical protein|nr:hypothetical protein [bacterium]